MILFLSLTLGLAAENYYFSQKTIRDKTQDYLSSMVDITAEELDRIIIQISDISRSVISDNSIQDQILEYDHIETDSLESITKKSHLLNAMETYALLRTEINSIYYKTEGGKEIHYIKRFRVTSPSTELYQTQTKDLAGRPFWFHDSTYPGILSCARLSNYRYTKDSIGYAIVNVDETYLEEIYEQQIKNNNGTALLHSSNGYVFSSNKKELLGTIEPIVSNPTTVVQTPTVVTYNGTKSMIYTSQLLSNDWYFTLIIPYSYHVEDFIPLAHIYMFSFLLTLIIAIVLIILLSNNIVAPLKDLDRAMTQFGAGDFSTRCILVSKNEFGNLSNMFNTMANNIVNLHEKIYIQQIQLKDAMLNYLQMQINPHFLYNTLDTINWLGQLNGITEVCDIAFSLASLMRYAFIYELQVPAQKELDNIRSYIQIQSFRYGDRLHVVYEIDESLLNVSVPKLILQPIIENSIIHGVEKKTDGGTIRIILQKISESTVEFSVMDDCGGMPPETIQKILEQIHQSDMVLHPSTSIGLVNVGKRICSTTSSDSNFIIESTLGEGTTVKMRFPISK